MFGLGWTAARSSLPRRSNNCLRAYSPLITGMVNHLHIWMLLVAQTKQRGAGLLTSHAAILGGMSCGLIQVGPTLPARGLLHGYVFKPAGRSPPTAPAPHSMLVTCPGAARPPGVRWRGPGRRRRCLGCGPNPRDRKDRTSVAAPLRERPDHSREPGLAHD